jgi:hypothetical protein
MRDLSHNIKQCKVALKDFLYSNSFYTLHKYFSYRKNRFYNVICENRMLRRIFGPKRNGVKGGWRKLHNEEFRNLYFSLNIIRIIKLRRMRWAGHVAQIGEKRNVYRLLVGKPEGQTPLERLRCSG